MVDQTAALASEADATRERIVATVGDLQHRLSPTTLVNNAVDSIGSSSSEAIASLRVKASSHPLALAATGLTIGIALLARSKIGRAKIEYGDSYAAYADYDDRYASDLADGSDHNPTARERIGAIGNKAQDTVGDSPLAVVGVGLATGVLIGWLIPESSAENKLFGSVRAKVSAAWRAAVDAVREELDVSKFSLKGGIAGISERATESLVKVAEAARAELVRNPPRRGR